MWLFAGVIGVVWALSWYLSDRLSPFDLAKSFETQSLSKYKRLTNKQGQITAVAISASHTSQIRFRRETLRDVWAKRWGLAVEITTGDSIFDDAIYIESDSPAAQKVLSTSTTLRGDLINLFASPIRAVEARRKVLAVYFNKPISLNSEALELIENSIVPQLYGLEKGLFDISQQAKGLSSDSSLQRAGFLTFSSWGLLLSSWMMYGGGEPYGPTLNIGDLWVWSLLRAPLLIFAVGSLWWTIIGKSSLRYAVMFDFALAGALGVFLLTVAVAQSVNQTNDSDETGQKISLKIDEKYSKWRSRRRGPGYWAHYVVVPNLTTNGGSSNLMRVPYDLFQRAEEGASLRLQIYSGYLHAKWIYDVELLDHSGRLKGRWPGKAFRIKSRWLPTRLFG